MAVAVFAPAPPVRHVPLTAKQPAVMLKPLLPVEVPVRPVSDVMSTFAPDAAAPRLVRAPDAVEAPVPPYAIDIVDDAETVPLIAWRGPVREPRENDVAARLPAVKLSAVVDPNVVEPDEVRLVNDPVPPTIAEPAIV